MASIAKCGVFSKGGYNAFIEYLDHFYVQLEQCGTIPNHMDSLKHLNNL